MKNKSISVLSTSENRKRTRRNAALFLLGAMLSIAITAVYLFFIDPILIDRENLIFVTGIATILVVGLAFLFRLTLDYLESGGEQEEKFDRSRQPYEYEEIIEKVAELSYQVRTIDQSFQSLEYSFNKISTVSSEEQKKELASLFRQQLSEEFAQDTLIRIEERVARRQKEISLRSEMGLTLRRLNQEIINLSRRGNFNLAIGIFTAIGGLIILGIVVFSAPIEFGNIYSIVSHYLPRITLVMFIELFAYFFLRLYRNSLADIKYFQNEITNIDLKFLAMTQAVESENDELIRSVSKVFAGTERNFVLEKGQTTVELERERLFQSARAAEIRAGSGLLSGWMRRRQH